MANRNHYQLWYLRRGVEVRGPFPAACIHDYWLLGRVRRNDELSQDRRIWRRAEEAVGRVVARPLNPLAAQSPYATEVAWRRADERSGQDRRRGNASLRTASERRRGLGDRRRLERPEVIRYRILRGEMCRPFRDDVDKLERRRLALALSLFAAIMILGFLTTREPTLASRVCAAAPAPEVNWSHCALQGLMAPGVDLTQAQLHSADLSGATLTGASLVAADGAYADLSLSDLSYSDFSNSNWRGANFRSADLSYAKLAGADLSYANLEHARLGRAALQNVRLDHAIWLDGRTCLAGSMGFCRLLP